MGAVTNQDQVTHCGIMLDFLYYQLEFKQRVMHIIKLKWGSTPKSMGNEYSNLKLMYKLKLLNFINVEQTLLSYSNNNHKQWHI